MNLKAIWERIGVRPWRALALLIGFAVLIYGVVPFARYFGVLDLLGFTCDAQEKAALIAFPQYGGRVIGKDIKGPLGGGPLNFPRCKRLLRAANWGSRIGGRAPSRSRLTTRSSLPSKDGRSNGIPYLPILKAMSQGTSYTRTSMAPAATYATRFTTGQLAYRGARKCQILRRKRSTGTARECRSSCTNDDRFAILLACPVGQRSGEAVRARGT